LKQARLEAGSDLPPSVTDFKGALQELAKARKLPVPRYVIVRERGPEHAKTFTVEVRVGGEWAQSEGRTKKIAAQRAARGIYERLVDTNNSSLKAP